MIVERAEASSLIFFKKGSRDCVYFLCDEEGEPAWVVKPIDKAVDAFAWRLAVLLQMPHITPRCVLEIRAVCGKKRLCSVQEFVSHEYTLAELAKLWIEANLSDDKIASSIDQKEFEELNLFIWILSDGDAHGGNILAQAQGGVYHLKKIDNRQGFARRLSNDLAYLPNAHFPISDELKIRISNLPIEAIVHEMHAFDLADHIGVLIERIQRLQHLSQRAGITCYEITNLLTNE